MVAFSQTEWAPIGAKWYFNRPSSESNDYVVFESTKDSIIQDKNVTVIDVRLNGTNLISQEYLHQSGDSLFYYNSNYDSFFLLYNFSAKAGDTITVHASTFKPTEAFFSYDDSISYFKYKITAIDSIELSGHWIKRQKVTALKAGDWGFFNGSSGDYYILKGIGSLTYFFGRSGYIIPEAKISILRCYHESGFEYKNPIWTQDCDIISSIRQKKLINNEIMVYPNPAKEKITLKSPIQISQMNILDLTGRTILQKTCNDFEPSMDIRELKPGVYFIQVTKGSSVTTLKFIKN